MVTYRLQDSAIITLPLSIRLLRLPVNYLFYLARTLWPVNLCPFFFGFPATPVWVLFACTVFLLLAAGAVRSFRHAPGILVGLLAFAGLLAPVSGIIFIGGVPVADRYSYLPALGLSLALLSFLDLLCGGVGAGAKLPPSTRHSSLVTRLCGGIAAAVVLAAEATVSLHILPFWKNPEALFERAEQIGPDHDLFQKHRFGEAFCTEGNLPSAATLSDTIFEKAPTSRYAILTKVLVLSQIQSSAAAVAFFEAHPPENRPNDPDHNPLALTLAALYADAGDFGMAAVHLGDALSNPNCFPEFRETVNAIAFWIYAIQNLPERAAAFARLVPSMDPDDPLAPSNFLIPLTTLWNMGLRRQILPRFLRLASTAPSNSALLNNIAWLLATTPNSPAPPDEVLAIARNACVLQPAHPVVRDTLAVALAFASRFDEAVAVEISVADFLRTSSAPEAPALLADVESRIALFRSRTPFTENAASKLLFAL